MLFRAAIGPINTDDYLPVFTRFEASGRAGASWNSAACLYTLNWLMFRGLWGAALCYAALLVFVPLFILTMGRLVWQWSEPVEQVVGLTGLVLLFVLPGVGANALFYQATRKNVAAALAATPTFEQACSLLLGQSSSRQRFIRILVTNAALLCLVAPLAVLLLTRPSPVTPIATTPLPIRAPEAALPSLPLLVAQPLTQASAPEQAVPSNTLPSEPMPMASTPKAATSNPTPTPTPTPIPPASAPLPGAAATATAISPAMPTSARVPSPPRQPVSHAASEGVFYVNVGLFADANNAQRAHDKLKGAGLPVLSQPVSGPKGELTRVRVGPFASRSKAEQAAKKIGALALDAVLVKP